MKNTKIADPIDAFISEKGLPKNRETYLKLAYLNEIPEKLGAEIEASLPDYAKETSDLSQAKVSRLSSK